MTTPRIEPVSRPADRSSIDHGALTNLGAERFPGFVGITVDQAGPGAVELRLELKTHHLAPNGYLHGGTVVTLADTACGYGTVVSLPEGARGFTTAELKTNFLSTATEGTILCRARLVHGGRTTQVWDATVLDAADERVLALFRCTNIVLWPRPEPPAAPPAEPGAAPPA